MGMTIDEIIQGIEVIKAQAEWDYPLDWQIVLNGAVDNMRKYQMFQAKHVERLKADMVAMLTEIQLEIEGLEVPLLYLAEDYEGGVLDCKKIIQQKINVLRGEEV